MKGRAAAAGSQGVGSQRTLGLEGRAAAGQAGPRLAGPVGWLRRLGQGAGGASRKEERGRPSGGASWARLGCCAAAVAAHVGQKQGGQVGLVRLVGLIRPIWPSSFFPISFTLFYFIYCLINSIIKCLYAKLD